MLTSQTEKTKDTFEVNINFKDLTIDRNEINIMLGYNNGNVQVHFDEMITQALDRLPELCKIKAGYRVVDSQKFHDRSNGLLIGGKFFELDKIVTGQLKKSDSMAMFVCTIGPGMENWSRDEIIKGEPAFGYIINSVASVAAESVTNYLHDFIGERMAENDLNITNRYSPGYCNWPVSEQQLLFSFFPKNFCGIKLNDSSLMTPIKSVSGIIGIGKEVKYKDYICDKCGIKDCTYRSKRKKN